MKEIYKWIIAGIITLIFIGLFILVLIIVPTPLSHPSLFGN